MEKPGVMKKSDQVRNVWVGYKVHGIRNVNAIDCTFSIDFKVFYYFYDAKAVGLKTKSTIDPDEGKRLGFFEPSIVNEAELKVMNRVMQVKDGGTGFLKLSVDYRGKLLIPNMSLHLFPFDVQQLRICIKPLNHTIDEVELHAANDDSDVEHHARHEWRILGHCTTTYATNAETYTSDDSLCSAAEYAPKVYSSLHIIVLVERESDWYVRSILMPMVSLVVLSMCCYAFKVDAIAGRMESSVALILTNIAMKFSVGDFMPKVPYRTLCDWYLEVSFFCQFGVCVSHAFIFLVHLALRNVHLRFFGLWAIRIDECLNVLCFLCAVGALVRLNVYAWRRLQRHHTEVELWRAQAVNNNGDDDDDSTPLLDDEQEPQPDDEPAHQETEDRATKTDGDVMDPPTMMMKRPFFKRSRKVLPQEPPKREPSRRWQAPEPQKSMWDLRREASRRISVGTMLFSPPTLHSNPHSKAPSFMEQGFNSAAYVQSNEFKRRRSILEADAQAAVRDALATRSSDDDQQRQRSPSQRDRSNVLAAVAGGIIPPHPRRD